VPFIHVRSLPLAGSFDVGAAVRAITRDFAVGARVEARHVTVTWEVIEPGHYAHAGKTATGQPARSHPVLVELLAPDFHDDESVERMLVTTAEAVAAQAGVPPENVFVEFRAARAGRVFDEGAIARW
jgi:hypothetical protein